MGKSVLDAVLDAALDYIVNNCNEMQACSAEPTTRTEAITTYMLADVAMTSGDFTKAAGDGTPAGRKVTVAAKNTVTIDTTGTATHVALTSATELLLVTTCTSIALTASQTVNFPSWKYDIDGPT